MRISFFVPEVSITGGMRLIYEYANRLTSRGHQVILYSKIIPYNLYKGKIKPYYIKYMVRYSINFLLGKISPPDDIWERHFKIKYLPFISNHFIDNGDILIATSWPTAFVVNKLSEKKGKKFYLVQDYEIWNSNPKFVDKSYKLPLNKITISSYLKKLLLEKFGEQSTLILNGINFEKFYNNNKVFNTPPKILFMDHPLPNKNVETAIKIVTEIKKEYPNIEIHCFGQRKYHIMPDFISFHKNISDEALRKLYCSSDIFLFPSKNEGFGGPPAEAMACKCAVVGNNVGALPDYAVNGETAILCNPDKPEELLNGIKYLINNQEDLKRISLAGYEYVKKKLDFNRAITELETLFNRQQN
ncbi:MAG: glycosyltransferase family 4 protein [Ignavibacteria bacterium]|nr:glycosyltransferase family 4 protein [Ignavibacteria bacterium]